jgi:hypothetical protein
MTRRDPTTEIVAAFEHALRKRGNSKSMRSLTSSERVEVADLAAAEVLRFADPGMDAETVVKHDFSFTN